MKVEISYIGNKAKKKSSTLSMIYSQSLAKTMEIEARSTQGLSHQRITHLDTIRGVAVMGILIMNSVAFFLGGVAYFDISFPENANWLDWLVAILGEIFADQKFMALFSLLFGASILLFCERAEAKGYSSTKLSLWRNFLLFLIGGFHAMLWEGDVLTVYAMCAPVLLMCRKLPPTLLIWLGCLFYLTPVIINWYLVYTIEPTSFRMIWDNSYLENSSMDIDLAGLGMMYELFARALGMMFIGMGLYSNGKLIHIVSTGKIFKRSIVFLIIGISLSGIGLVWTYLNEFSTAAIIQGNLANTVGTIPVALAYVGLLIWWNERTKLHIIKRIQALGKTALSNYIGQTVVCLSLAAIIPQEWLSRSIVFLLIVVIWWLQLFVSEQWLKRYKFGPMEYLWRCVTYRRLMPIIVHQDKAILEK